jgi:hypothetical protein
MVNTFLPTAFVSKERANDGRVDHRFIQLERVSIFAMYA